jgi:hypothetical protein
MKNMKKYKHIVSEQEPVEVWFQKTPIGQKVYAQKLKIGSYAQ